ncbi:hypothetical protein [Alcanivorax sp.]|uniref:helix-turn-helix domain-containing protein n=1 Tax=Alcanivorax sp. TaxID=1872427 RepID=UPI002585A5C9|nr:hypothetical protein [Alcanivorax sp.]
MENLLPPEVRLALEEYEHITKASVRLMLKMTGLTQGQFARMCGITDRALRYKLSDKYDQKLSFPEFFLLRQIYRRYR